MATTDRSPTAALVEECLDLSSNCMYSAANFYLWLKVLRRVRIAFVVVPLVLGSFATWNFLATTDTYGVKVVAALCAFIAGLLPTVYRALKFDDNLATCVTQATEFNNLHDRFRQCAKVASLKPFAEFEAEFQMLMKRLEVARAPGFTPPEWCFKRAQRKVKSGDYTADAR